MTRNSPVVDRTHPVAATLLVVLAYWLSLGLALMFVAAAQSTLRVSLPAPYALVSLLAYPALGLVLRRMHRHARAIEPVSVPGGGALFVAGVLAAWPIHALATLQPRFPGASLPSAWPGQVAIAAVAFLVAPLVEEWCFREVLWSRVKPLCGSAHAVVATAVAFAVCHPTADAMTTSLVAGVGLGWVRARYDNLWPAVFAHAGLNAAPYLWGLRLAHGATDAVFTLALSAAAMTILFGLQRRWGTRAALPKTPVRLPRSALHRAVHD